MKKTTKKPPRNNRTAKKKTVYKARTASGRVPQGRTLSTRDNYLSGGKKTSSTKERPVVVVEANDRNDLAVVPLSSFFCNTY